MSKMQLTLKQETKLSIGASDVVSYEPQEMKLFEDERMMRPTIK